MASYIDPGVNEPTGPIGKQLLSMAGSSLLTSPDDHSHGHSHAVCLPVYGCRSYSGAEPLYYGNEMDFCQKQDKMIQIATKATICYNSRNQPHSLLRPSRDREMVEETPRCKPGATASGHPPSGRKEPGTK